MRNSNLGDKVRLQHIIKAINEIEKYLENVSFNQFLTNSEKRFATIKQVEIVGEASNALTAELKASAPSVPWAEIRGFRNISIHEYFQVNMELVWNITQNALPALKQNIELLLNTLET